LRVEGVEWRNWGSELRLIVDGAWFRVPGLEFRGWGLDIYIYIYIYTYIYIYIYIYIPETLDGRLHGVEDRNVNVSQHPLTRSLAVRACAGAPCTPSRRIPALSTVSNPPSLSPTPLT